MSEVFDGTVEVQDAAASTTVVLDGATGDGTLGGNGQDGTLELLDAADNRRLTFEAGDNTISIRDATGNPLLEVQPDGAIVIQRVISGANRTVLALDPASPAIEVGADGAAGTIRAHDAANRQVLHFDAASAALYVGAQGNEGDIIVRDGGGRDVFHFNASAAALYVGADGNEGDIIVRDGRGRDVLHFNAQNAALYVGANGNEGDVILRNTSGHETIQLDGGEGDIFVRRRYGKASRTVFQFDASNGALYLGCKGNEGDLLIRDNDGGDAIHLNGKNAQIFVGKADNEGDIIVRDNAGRDVFHFDGGHAVLTIGANGNEGDLVVLDQGGRDVFRFNAEHAILDIGADGNEGDIRVRDGNGTTRIHLDGNSGDIKLHGADCAERFDVADATNVDEGTVLVIDDSGGLRSASRAYDRRVAGVVSGAGAHKPGIILDSAHDSPDRRNVALVGKVYCKVDAEYGEVGVGDLLTTSDTPGHAMRAADPLQAFGAVIGKALAPLRAGRGLVPILVALQ